MFSMSGFLFCLFCFVFFLELQVNQSMDQCFGANHNYIVGGFLSVSEPTLPLSLSVNFNF